jgi:hypothetical protein
MEEDLARVSQECILSEAQKKEYIQTAFSQVITKLGVFIDIDNSSIKKRVPGLFGSNVQNYQLGDSRISVFILPSEITAEDGTTLTFQDIVRKTEYEQVTENDVQGVHGFSTGMGGRFTIKDDVDGDTIFIDSSDRVILAAEEVKTEGGIPDTIAIEKTIRHELCHALGVANRIPILYLREAVIEYYAWDTGRETYPVDRRIGVGYGPAFGLIFRTLDFLQQRGVPRDTFAKAYIKHDRESAQTVEDTVDIMFREAGLDTNIVMNNLSKYSQENYDEAMDYFREINQKLDAHEVNP